MEKRDSGKYSQAFRVVAVAEGLCKALRSGFDCVIDFDEFQHESGALRDEVDTGVENVCDGRTTGVVKGVKAVAGWLSSMLSSD